MRFLSLIPVFLSLATGAIAAPSSTAADSLVVKQDANSALKALNAEVKQRTARMKTAVSSMNASSRVAQNATSKATIEREMRAMTAAIRKTTSTLQASQGVHRRQVGVGVGAPTEEPPFPLGVLLASISNAVILGEGLVNLGSLVDAVMSLLAQLLTDGVIGGGIRVLLALFQQLLSIGQPAVPVTPRPTPTPAAPAPAIAI